MLNSLVWAKAVAEMRATLMTNIERISPVRRIWEGECEEMYGNSGKRAYEGRILEKEDGERECSKVEHLIRCDLRDFMDGQQDSPQRIVQELFCFGNLP